MRRETEGVSRGMREDGGPVRSDAGLQLRSISSAGGRHPVAETRTREDGKVAARGGIALFISLSPVIRILLAAWLYVQFIAPDYLPRYAVVFMRALARNIERVDRSRRRARKIKRKKALKSSRRNTMNSWHISNESYRHCKNK